MGEISITIDKTDLSNYLQEKASEIVPKGIEVIDSIAENFKDIMLNYLPIGETHQLYDQTIVGEEGTFDRWIGSLAPEAVFVIGPDKPHSIGGPVFIWNIGEWRYIGLSPNGKGKIHPGYAGNNYPELTFMDGISEAENKLDEFLNWMVD
jgi:hypothetical protein